MAQYYIYIATLGLCVTYRLLFAAFGIPRPAPTKKINFKVSTTVER